MPAGHRTALLPCPSPLQSRLCCCPNWRPLCASSLIAHVFFFLPFPAAGLAILLVMNEDLEAKLECIGPLLCIFHVLCKCVYAPGRSGESAATQPPCNPVCNALFPSAPGECGAPSAAESAEALMHQLFGLVELEPKVPDAVAWAATAAAVQMLPEDDQPLRRRVAPGILSCLSSAATFVRHLHCVHGWPVANSPGMCLIAPFPPCR